MLQNLLWLAVGGALGTLARYALAGLVQRVIGGSFPGGTLAVNIAGCFLVGTFLALAESRLNVSGQMRLVILVGFFGAFTTFSTFVLETGGLFRNVQWSWAVGNMVLQNTCGIVCFFLGLSAGRFL